MLRFVRMGFRPSRLPAVRTSIRARASSTAVAAETQSEPVPTVVTLEEIASFVATEFPEAAEDWRNVVALNRDLEILEEQYVAEENAPQPQINWGFFRKASRNPSLIDKIEKLTQEAKAKPRDDAAFSAKFRALMDPIDEAALKELKRKHEPAELELKAAMEVAKTDLVEMQRKLDETMEALYMKRLSYWAEKYPQSVIDTDARLAKDDWPDGEQKLSRQLTAEEKKALDERVDPQVLPSSSAKQQPHH